MHARCHHQKVFIDRNILSRLKFCPCHFFIIRRPYPDVSDHLSSLIDMTWLQIAPAIMSLVLSFYQFFLLPLETQMNSFKTMLGSNSERGRENSHSEIERPFAYQLCTPCTQRKKRKEGSEC